MQVIVGCCPTFRVDLVLYFEFRLCCSLCSNVDLLTIDAPLRSTTGINDPLTDRQGDVTRSGKGADDIRSDRQILRKNLGFGEDFLTASVGFTESEPRWDGFTGVIDD